jgi:hypothetical protein
VVAGRVCFFEGELDNRTGGIIGEIGQQALERKKCAWLKCVWVCRQVKVVVGGAISISRLLSEGNVGDLGTRVTQMGKG